jgi:hypothetical protein
MWIAAATTTLLVANPLFSFAQQEAFLSTPGARSSAMGGAFAGLADDATAALTNPAGLLTLSAPEIAVEFGFRRQRVLCCTFLGESFVLNRETGIPYVAFVYPRSKWALGLYRREVSHSELDYTRLSDSGDDLLTDRVALSADQYGVSGAYLLGRNIKVGGGLTVNVGRIRDVREFFPGEGARESTTSGTEIGFQVGGLAPVFERVTGPVTLVQVGAFLRRLADTRSRNPADAPDQFAVGAAIRLGQSLTGTFEYLRSQFYTGRGVLKFSPDYSPRAGFEWVLPIRLAPAVRGGYWRDPVGMRNNAVPENHFTFGGGVSVSRQLEFNVGIDRASQTQVTASGILRFMR